MLVERPATFRFPLYRRSLRTELEVPTLESSESSPARSSSQCADFECKLSRRELEVVKLVSTGMTNREIATKLFIAERTAEGHVERIRNKLDVRSRTEVAVWAARHGLAAA
jgi:DNA-binding NarL/FixJ family response regulator